jgi:MoaD family protein
VPALRANFYAFLRKISGTKTQGFQLPEGATVKDLLEAVIDRYPQMRDLLLDENGELDRRAHIFINGRNCPLLAEGLETQLTADDSIDIFPIGHF